MEDKAVKRLYFSIAQVSKMTGLKPYVLRYWETEFSQLRPAKNSAGNRIYRKSDIKMVFLIKRLLYQEKYTIEGARQFLVRLRQQRDKKLQMSLNEMNKNDLVQEIKKILHEMLDILQGDGE